jgi:hypothetical protein
MKKSPTAAIKARLGDLNAQTIAKLSSWSPFAACVWLVPVLILEEFCGIHCLWMNLICFGLFCLLVVSGFVLGCVVLARMKRQTWKAVSVRAAIGVCLNAGLILVFCLALASFFKGADLSGSQQPSGNGKDDRGAGLREALVRNARFQAAFEKVASQKSNNLTQLARPAIDFLRDEQTVLSNYYAAAKPLIQHPLLNTADVHDQRDLEKRRMLVLNFVDANRSVSNYYRSVENDFHTMAIKGGLPEATVEEQTERFHTNMNKMSQLPAIWETNDRWAKSELRALDLLVSNRQSWSYDGSLRKTVFHDENVRTEFNGIVAEINAIDKERKQLQHQLQQKLQENPMR